MKTAQRARLHKAANDDQRIPWGNADPVDAMFRTIAEQGRRAHLDTLTPERRAELQQEWNND